MGMTGKVSRFLAAAIAALAVIPAAALAQQGTTISGQVTGTGGAPVVGASVSIPTLRVGGFTDDAGRFTFAAPASANGTTVTLLARRLGFQPSSAQVTLSGSPVTQNFSLSTAATELQGVVVTALGLTRERSQLGTAQQQLSSAELNQTRSLNVIEQMEGKVSGVTITGSGTQGGSTNLVIRGANSITGSNQPLFVVDGVPLANRGRGTGPNSATGGDPNGGFDFGSSISDINPDNIATMSVLKGPNAAALYGSRAANGVVIITTKKGASSGNRARTEISSTYTWDRPSILPEYQNQYGQGAAGEFAYVDGAGGGVNDFLDQSFGPKLDGRSTGCTFIPKGDPRYSAANPHVYDNTAPCTQFTALNGAPWVAHPNNVEDFFNTGHTRSTTLAVSGGNERASARLSFGRDNITGYVPNNNFQKTSALLNGSLTVNSHISTDATLQYIHNTAMNRPGVGYNNGILESFVWFGRQVDIDALRNYGQGGAINGGPSNREYNWNYNYHNNPFWVQFENPLQDVRDRFIGTLSATYKLTDWANLIGRTGSDIYRFNIDQRWAANNIQGNPAPSDPAYFGALAQINDYSNQNNSDLILTVNRGLGSRLALNGTLGGTVRRELYDSHGISTSGLSVAGIYNISNAAITPIPTQFLSRRQVNSIYADAAVTLNNWWTVEGTARNDWSSTLPKGNNSYFYPSVSTSVVVTDAIPSLKNNWLSYMKLRGSIAQVGNDADPYQLLSTYVGTNPISGQPQFTYQDKISNPNLKPEKTNAKELGLELSLLDGRATFDFSLYNKATLNQIFSIPVSPASGFVSKSVNAGEIDNKGIDFLLGVTPLQMDNGFGWTSTFNYARNKSMVKELAPGIDTYVIGTSWYTNIEARAGEPYGAIFGYAFARDEATGKILTQDGITVAGDRVVLGNIQPKWTGGWNNTFTFKNFTLSGLLDFRRGGNIVSITNFFGDYAGVTKQTLRGRENDWNDPGIVVDGIDIDTGNPNTTQITSEEYFQNIFPVMEPYVYDASYVKLRELRFGMDLPASWASRVNARAVNIALTGRNLHTWTKVPNIDPEFSYTVGNFQGIEFAALPNARTIGLSFRITP
ncbi:MAG TPA: SusC/RagA family TonB-linked outer membrane protein [Gemmatimonadaceae bacterium]|nr:SusC/RagA family TonB-linked outer membrane protein [Gemmatimonadaceae bacterium]